MVFIYFVKAKDRPQKSNQPIGKMQMKYVSKAIRY